MEKYKNLSGNSGVDRFELSDTSIKIQFVTDNDIYVYTYRKPGQAHVEKMKQLAIAGIGLATYINKKIRKNFDHKE